MPRFASFIQPFLFCLCGVLGAAHAQGASPAQGWAGKTVGETIADRPSNLYRYEKHRLDSADGKRHYRIEISIPRVPAPAGGYAALYMLDGNAAMDTLTEDDLASISSGGHPPVLVAVGYDIPVRNDVVSRAYDYTPPVHENGKLIAEPVVRGHVGGGADVFLDFIAARVKPLVRARAGTDPKKEYLWGHSYGGLFVLHTLFTRPDAFARYIAGDPSVWWHDGALLREWQAFEKERAAGKRVAILVGAKPRDPARPAPGASMDTRAIVEDMAEGLRRGGGQVSYEAFPQYGHGEMIRVSLERALRIAAEP
ncbi:MAG: alpha/beta hydrolase-fold protein [Alcaligenaceae bacterium]|nr:alpha/beta hydrolase-fold protein [Alcaligenaceae bacterium]